MAGLPEVGTHGGNEGGAHGVELGARRLGERNWRAAGLWKQVDESIDRVSGVEPVGGLGGHHRNDDVQPDELVVGHPTQRFAGQEVRRSHRYGGVDHRIPAGRWPQQDDPIDQAPVLKGEANGDGHTVGTGHDR